jgi:hypothetical protein
LFLLPNKEFRNQLGAQEKKHGQAEAAGGYNPTEQAWVTRPTVYKHC